MTAIGLTRHRVEDNRLLTGNGNYVTDQNLPGTKHVAFLRSPHGHAKLLDVDTTDVNDSKYRVFTGDMPMFASMGLMAKSALPSYVETTQPPLARGKVRFSGEPVAAVVAADRYAAEDGLNEIRVQYEALPATVDAWDKPEVPVHEEAPDNVLLERTFEAGDLEDAFSRSAVIVEREFTTNRHAGNPIEPRAGVALWDKVDEKLTFWSGTQIPHLVRNMLAELLGLPEGNVRVIAPDVGGGFGVKAVLYPEDLALCIMAREMRGTPLKWVEDRGEHLQTAAHARDHRYTAKAGFDSDGKLLAVDADVSCNIGAYSVYPWTAGIEPLMAGGLLSGPYQLENYRCTTRGVTTNTSYAGPYRGVARPSTVFVMESLMNLGGAELGISSVEMRRRNLITPEMIPYRMPSRLVDDSGWYGECLEKCLEEIDYEWFLDEKARRNKAGENPIGLGVACYNELTGLGRAASAGPKMPFRTGHDACTVRMEADGTVTVLSGVTDQGQGLRTTMAQVVAEAIGVEPDQVTVRIGDTNESLWGFGAFSSRQAVIGGGAAFKTGEAVREQILELAAGLYEMQASQLTITHGKIFNAESGEPLTSVQEIARIAYMESNRLPKGIDPGLQATKFYDPVLGVFAAGAQAAVIEIDPSNGQLTFLKWACSEDAGRAINPMIVDGQIYGSIAQGIGGAMYEHLVYDEAGNLSTGTLMDYLMPTTHEIPDISIVHVEHPADNPIGVRGVGEGGTLGPNAVITGAILDAVGLEITQLPVTPGLVWEGLSK